MGLCDACMGKNEYMTTEERAVLEAAEKWWAASFVGERLDAAGPVTLEARLRNPGWGCGTDDEYTLASAVARMLEARGGE